jgi:hypothetical protein
MKKIFHWFAHLLKMHEGKLVFWTANDKNYVGFKCSGCGKVQGVEETWQGTTTEFS